MNLITLWAVAILKFLGTHWLHSTVIFFIIRMLIGQMSLINKEQLLRFSLLGGIATPLLQLATGWGFQWPISSESDTLTTGAGITESSPAAFWPVYCVALWLGVVIVLIVKHILTYRSFIRSISPTHELPEKTTEWLVLNADLFGPDTKSRVLLTQKKISPFIHAGNKLVFPEMAFEKLNNSELRATFAHEVAHVRRRDWYWLHIYRFIECIFFFQPLHRITKKLLIRNAESICDRRAVQFLHDGQSLAMTILEIAGWSLNRPKFSVPAMSASRSVLEERIKNILEGRVAARNKPGVTFFVTLFLATLCVCCTPKFYYQQPDSSGIVRKKDHFGKQNNLKFEDQNKSIPLQYDLEKNTDLELDINSTPNPIIQKPEINLSPARNNPSS